LAYKTHMSTALVLTRVGKPRYCYPVLSVCLSDRRTYDLRSNGSRYRNAFAPHDRAIFLVSWGQFRGRAFTGSPQTSVLNRGKVDNNLQ